MRKRSVCGRRQRTFLGVVVRRVRLGIVLVLVARGYVGGGEHDWGFTRGLDWVQRGVILVRCVRSRAGAGASQGELLDSSWGLVVVFVVV